MRPLPTRPLRPHRPIGCRLRRAGPASATTALDSFLHFTCNTSPSPPVNTSERNSPEFASPWDGLGIGVSTFPMVMPAWDPEWSIEDFSERNLDLCTALGSG